MYSSKCSPVRMISSGCVVAASSDSKQASDGLFLSPFLLFDVLGGTRGSHACALRPRSSADRPERSSAPGPGPRRRTGAAQAPRAGSQRGGTHGGARTGRHQPPGRSAVRGSTAPGAGAGAPPGTRSGRSRGGTPRRSGPARPGARTRTQTGRARGGATTTTAGTPEGARPARSPRSGPSRAWAPCPPP